MASKIIKTKTKQKSKRPAETQSHTKRVFNGGMELIVPVYERDGKRWVPSTPEEAGAYEGMQWVKSASASSLRNVAERLTTNELINQHISWCKQCESKGESYNGDLSITPPSELDSDVTVREFFRKVVKSLRCYYGNDEDIKIGKYAITGIPVHNIRAFEDGWTAVVRKHWDKMKMAEHH